MPRDDSPAAGSCWSPPVRTPATRDWRWTPPADAPPPTVCPNCSVPIAGAAGAAGMWNHYRFGCGRTTAGLPTLWGLALAVCLEAAPEPEPDADDAAVTAAEACDAGIAD